MSDLIGELNAKIDNYEKIVRELQEENQELSKMCEMYSKSVYYAELTTLKQRINKAIEYINENTFVLDIRGYQEELIEILEGGR